jgi:hypothetical protein
MDGFRLEPGPMARFVEWKRVRLLPRAGRRPGEAESAEGQGRGETPDREEPTMVNNTQQILRILNNSNLRLFEKLNLIDGMGAGQGEI